MSTAPRPTCSTYYRASVTVPPDEGPILTFATPGSSEATFSDLNLTATYSDDGFESPSLNVRVETMPDRALVFASLYQFVRSEEHTSELHHIQKSRMPSSA